MDFSRIDLLEAITKFKGLYYKFKGGYYKFDFLARYSRCLQQLKNELCLRQCRFLISCSNTGQRFLVLHLKSCITFYIIMVGVYARFGVFKIARKRS